MSDQPITGILRPGEWLTKEGVQSCLGWARKSLHDAIDSGIVKPVEHGNRLHYSSDELIAFLEAKRAKATGSPGA